MSVDLSYIYYICRQVSFTPGLPSRPRIFLRGPRWAGSLFPCKDAEGAHDVMLCTGVPFYVFRVELYSNFSAMSVGPNQHLDLLCKLPARFPYILFYERWPHELSKMDSYLQCLGPRMMVPARIRASTILLQQRSRKEGRVRSARVPRLRINLL